MRTNRQKKQSEEIKEEQSEEEIKVIEEIDDQEGPGTSMRPMEPDSIQPLISEEPWPEDNSIPSDEEEESKEEQSQREESKGEEDESKDAESRQETS